MRRVLFVLVLLSASAAPSVSWMKLDSDRTEASDLLRVRAPEVLAAFGFEEAYWSVSDEGPVDEGLFLIGRDARGWRVRAVAGEADARTDDAEALCRHDGRVYVVGSHFGKKEGPLEPDRHFVARFREADAARGPVRIEVARTDFALHRAINDAFASVPLLPRREPEDAYLDGVAGVRPHDRPLNVEGAAFLASGELLLGLRFPVTKAGGPVLVRLAGVAGLFAGETPRVAAVLTPAMPKGAHPRGVRALRREGGRLHLIAGSLDSKPKKSAVLKAHPTGAAAQSLHVVWPLAGGPARVVRAFAVRDVEGIALDASGRAVYARDDRDIRIAVGSRP